MSTKWVQVGLAALAGAGIATLVFTASPLRAQGQWRSMPMGWHMDNIGERPSGYPGGPGIGNMPCINGGAVDPATLETWRGTINRIDRYSGHQGVFAWLQTNQTPVEVHLGPAWYLESQGFEVIPDSLVEVTGFRSQLNDQSVVMVSEIKQGDRVLQLRDANGYPLWMDRGIPAN